MQTANRSNPHWLNVQRLTIYPRMLAGLFALLCVIWLCSLKNGLDYTGNPVGNDFVTFWGAAQAGLSGHAPDAYQATKIVAYEKLAVPASQKVFGWFYPPSFFLLMLPLGRLPYLTAYLIYIGGTLALFVAMMRRVVRGPVALWCLAGFSGVWINFLDGQNGFLTAGLAAAAILCLRSRPWLAGVLIGLLSIKPHLVLLFPVALLAIGAWRPMLSAALTATALLAAGTAVLGEATLRAWLGSVKVAGMLLEQGGLPWQKMPTMFALVRMLHAPVWLAYGLHALLAAAAATAVWFVWRRSDDWQLRGAALLTATFLVSPYVFDYDLVWLAFAIAWLALVAVRDGWVPYERELLLAAWLLPLLMAPLASTTHVQLGPLVLVGVLGCVVRRVWVADDLETEVRGGAELATI